jgi:hypothetical protein
MASVYLARQLDLDRLVALKELRVFQDRDASIARRFLREAQLAGSLSHQNIVTVHEYFEDHGVPHIAMEYLPRGSLRRYVGRVGLGQIGGILEGLLGGLAHAERQQVVHRDIKPENVLITAEGGVKIADFGIAKATHTVGKPTQLTELGSTVGTPSYIAPEQAMAGQLGPWTDLYSVGITTFELFVGRTPFGDSEQPMAIVLRQINEPVPHLTNVVPGVDPWVADWVAWLLAKDPAARPQSADEAWSALEEALIRLLGPRWRREAPLFDSSVTSPTLLPEPVLARTVPPVGAAALEQPAEPAPRRRRRLRLLTALIAVLTSAAMAVAAAVGSAVGFAAAAAVLALLWIGGRLLRHAGRGIASAVAPRRRRRMPIALLASLAGLALLLLGMSGRLGAGGARTHATVQEQAALTAGRQGAQRLPAAPTDLTTTTTKPPRGGQGGRMQSGAPLSAQRTEASGLAQAYQKAAASASPTGPEAPLHRALTRTAQAYSTAAAAAARGDSRGYSNAIAAAGIARQAVATQLARLPHAAPSTTSTPPPPSPCAGDSVSDDPSDDACNN